MKLDCYDRKKSSLPDINIILKEFMITIFVGKKERFQGYVSKMGKEKIAEEA